MTPDPDPCPSLRSIIRGLSRDDWVGLGLESSVDDEGGTVFLAKVTRGGCTIRGQGWTPMEAWATLAEMARRIDAGWGGAACRRQWNRSR